MLAGFLAGMARPSHGSRTQQGIFCQCWKRLNKRFCPQLPISNLRYIAHLNSHPITPTTSELELLASALIHGGVAFPITRNLCDLGGHVACRNEICFWSKG